MTIKNELETATTSFNKYSEDYQATLFKYVLLLMSSELALIAFLLQNSVTQKLLASMDLKVTFLIMLSSTLCCMACCILLARSQRLYEKNNLHVIQYKAMAKYPILMYGEKIDLKGDYKDNEKKAFARAARYARSLEKLLTAVEATLVSAGLSGAVFVFVVLLRV